MVVKWRGLLVVVALGSDRREEEKARMGTTTTSKA
jgi:hypothetical protein